MPTTKGSRWFADQPPKTADSLHVGRLRAAGAIPIGKTAAPEFGAWAYTASPLLGVTRNPWDPAVTPGGSSGGSTAAVSVGMVPFGTASDGGGSIRTPAAFTGLVGLRPSYGRIPTFGDTHLAQNAVVGSVTTTVADTALLLDVMAGPDARDRTCLPRARRSATSTPLEQTRPVRPPGRLVGRPRLRRRRSRGRGALRAGRPRAGGRHRRHAGRHGRAARRLHAHLRLHRRRRQVRRRRPRPVGAPPRRARPAHRPRLALPQPEDPAVAGRGGGPTAGAWSSRWRRSTRTSTCSSRRWRPSRPSRPRGRCPPRSPARRSTAGCRSCSASSPAW